MAKIREARPERANRASPSEAASYVEEFDRMEQDREGKLRTLDIEFKAKKRAINAQVNDEQKGILADAKKMGVGKGLIRALADAQRDRRKAQIILDRANGRTDNLDADDREFAIDIRKALPEDFISFGLGAAAVERADREADEAEDKPDARAVAAAKAWEGADGAQAH